MVTHTFNSSTWAPEAAGLYDYETNWSTQLTKKSGEA